MRIVRRGLAAALAALALFGPAAARAQPYPLSIATGGVTGVYYQIGAAICRLLRDHPPSLPIECTTEGSPGAVRNLIALREGTAKLALVQADTLYYAVRGEGPFAAFGPDRQVRALFTPLTETVNVVTRADEPAASLADLRGRRLNIGAPGSGTEVTFRRLMVERGWTDADFAGFTDFRTTLLGTALCGERTDGVVFVSANPSGAMQDATFTCNARLVPIADSFMTALGRRYPFYTAAVIPGGTYRGNPEPVPTVGVRATLVASEATPPEVVQAVMRAVLDHVDELRTLHLAFTGIERDEVVRQCVFARHHPGALRYFRERGLTARVCPQVSEEPAG